MGSSGRLFFVSFGGFLRVLGFSVFFGSRGGGGGGGGGGDFYSASSGVQRLQRGGPQPLDHVGPGFADSKGVERFPWVGRGLGLGVPEIAGRFSVWRFFQNWKQRGTRTPGTQRETKETTVVSARKLGVRGLVGDV